MVKPFFVLNFIFLWKNPTKKYILYCNGICHEKRKDMRRSFMKLHIPVQIIAEENCIKNNSEIFKNTGNKPLIVTYPPSLQNGALDDVKTVIEGFELYMDSPQNPSLDDVRHICKQNAISNCDYIIAIGGGSVIDLAKAIAIIATNNIDAKELYTTSVPNAPLSIIAIPTTCGTGSEVTPVSVLTVGDTKLSFSKDCIIPKYALLDAKYIANLPMHLKRYTAVDAFCHCAEGYLMVDDDPSDMFAESAFNIFAECMPSLISGEFSKETDNRLLYMGTLGGLTINITRTAAPHAMGYVLTVKKGLHHGLACGLLIGEYIAFSYEAKRDKINKLLSILKVKSIEELKEMLNKILNYTERFTQEEIAYFTEITYKPATGKPNPKPLTKEDVYNIYTEAIGIG